MAATMKAPRGTQDVLPKDSYKWQLIERHMSEVSLKYGFREIRIPTFEHTDLFFRSVGDTSDVVEKEMYTFEDKSSRLITLRPEGTAGVIRSVIENGLLNDALPLKLNYIVSCFRYEKPDSGRLREFHQFGAELLGSSSPQADAEIIQMGFDIFHSLKISNISLQINSIGCKSCRSNFHEALIKYLLSCESQLCEICKSRLHKNPMRILDCKSPGCQEIVEKAPIILDYLCDDCDIHFSYLQDYLNNLGISYTVNPKIVRGLDYYTRTVFEFIVNVGGNDLTICGGGRYDKLIEELGGPSTPALGFGIGLERTLMVLENLNLELPYHNCDLYIAVLDKSAYLYSASIVRRLRSEGFVVETDLMNRSLKSQMKYANKIGARYSMVIGENEMLSGKSSLKDMLTSTITEVDVSNFSLY